MQVREFQELIARKYKERDTERGVSRTFLWFIEEVGELSEALRKVEEDQTTSLKDLVKEFADVLAWLCSLANLLDVDLDKAINEKYPGKCLKCGNNPCSCEKI